MIESEHFFSAPNLDEDESVIRPTAKEEIHSTDFGIKPPTETFFHACGLDGDPLSIRGGISVNSDSEEAAKLECNIVLEEEQNKFSEFLLRKASDSNVKRVPVDTPKERVIIRFEAKDRGIERDIDVPLSITANDLIVGLNEAYHLGLDSSDARQCYLSCENPIILLRGNKTLGEFGIRDGSLIAYYR